MAGDAERAHDCDILTRRQGLISNHPIDALEKTVVALDNEVLRARYSRTAFANLTKLALASLAGRTMYTGVGCQGEPACKLQVQSVDV